MTDEELIQLVQDKSPEDLTPQQIVSLRQRLLQSESLRNVIFGEMELEGYVVEALDRIELSVDDLVDREMLDRRNSRHGFWKNAAFLLALVSLIGVVVTSRSFGPQTADSVESPSEDQKDDQSQESSDDEVDPSGGEESTSSPDAIEKIDSQSDKINPEKKDPSEAKPPEPVEPKTPSPWQAVLESDAVPAPFSEVCFDTFDTATLPTEKELRQWFEAVPGHKSRFFQQKTSIGDCGWLEGLARLKSPWRNDTALRVWLEQYNRLQIHFFSGNEGVTLAYYENEKYRWGGYVTSRKDNTPKPYGYVLTATDEHRNARTEIRFGGPYELRYRENEIILSRGDVVLIRVPTSGPIDEVFFEGRTAFHGIELIRTNGFPPRDEPFPIAGGIEQPATMKWTDKCAAGAYVEYLDDGAVRLFADNAKAHGWAIAPLPRLGIHEVILELDDVTEGTGVIIGNEQQGPVRSLRFSKNKRDGRLCASMNVNAHTADFGIVSEKLIPYCGSHVWIKLLAGQGTFRYWLSNDGVHWGAPEGLFVNATAGATHIGLDHLAGVSKCGITLSRVSMRKLPVIGSLVDNTLFQRASSFHKSQNFAQWAIAVIQSCPSDVTLDQWTCACVVRCLSEGSNQVFANQLLGLVLDSDVSRTLPWRQRLKLFSEVALLADVRSQGELQALVKRYHRFAIDVARDQNELPFSLIRHSLMTAPFAMWHNVRVADESTVRLELIKLLYSGHYQEALEFCSRLKFFQQQQEIPLVEWAEFTAHQKLPRAVGGLDISRRSEWFHPFEPEYSREAYNLLAELQALLDSDAVEEVAQMIVSMNPRSFNGVAPHASDADLYVSLTTAVRLAARENPALSRAINEKHGQLGDIRVGHAIGAGDMDALKLAAVQFEATPAAAKAHQWLGDRALSSGWFTRALAEYRRAETTASVTGRSELAARMRLAGAMLGRDVGEPVKRPVHLGEVSFSVDDFESLVEEMRARGPTGLTTSGDSSSDHQTIPNPTRFQVDARMPFDDRVGRDSSTEVLRHVARHKVDWVNQQIATVVDGDTLYASNRFQIVACDLNSGGRLWQSQHPPGQMMRSQDWSLTQMKPVLVGRQILARQLFGSSPCIVCCSRENGEINWVAQPRSGESFVTDPFVVQDRLAAITMRRSDRHYIVRLTTLAPESGEILQQEELTRLRDSWSRRRFCSAIAMDDAVVVSLGGVVLCVDVAGEVRWIRRQVTMPNEEEHTSITQHFQSPALYRNRLYIVQPGVRSIECLDPDTGRLIWNLTLPGLRRLCGLSQSHAIVETNDGFCGINIQSGQVAWRHSAQNRLYGLACDGGGLFVYSQRTRLPNDPTKFRPQLIWLDCTSGKPQSRAVLTELTDVDPRIGTISFHGEKLFTFYGKEMADPVRELIRLTPDGDAQRLQAPIVLSSSWTGRVPVDLRISGSELFKDWTLLSGEMPDPSKKLADSLGQVNTLLIDATPKAPVIFGRFIELPADRSLHLRAEFGDLEHAGLRIHAAVNGEIVYQNTVDTKFPDQTWRIQDIDLSKHRGKKVWITIAATPVNITERRTISWRQLRLVD